MRAALLGLMALGLVAAALVFLLGTPPRRSRGSTGPESTPVVELRSPGPLAPTAVPGSAAPDPASGSEPTRSAVPESAPAKAAVAQSAKEAVAAFRSLQVRLVDSAGQPVAAALVVLELSGRSQHSLKNLTGASGLATFEQVGKGWSEPVEGLRGRARAAGLFRNPVAADFSTVDWPREPIELVLPATGSVVVELRDPAGRPVSSERDVTLEVEGRQPSGTYLWGQDSLQYGAAVVDGVARFERVEPGLVLRVRADCRPEHGVAEQTFLGPARAGQQVTVTLMPAGSASWIVLRLLSPSGEPLSGRPVEVSWERRVSSATLRSGGAIQTTDESGRLRLALQEPWYEGTTLTLLLEHAPTTRQRWRAQLDLSRSFPAGDSDLGDLRLLPAAVLVAGRVVDEQGQAVPSCQARVEVDYSRTGANWRSRYSTVGDGQGDFAFHEEVGSLPVRLVLLPAGFVQPDPIPFVPGTDDLEIVVRRGGGLEGSLKPLEGIEFGDLYLTAERGGEDAGGEAEIESDGSFRITGLPSGSLEVVFGTHAVQGPLLTIPGLAVVRGEEQRDPRLQEVDLSPHLRSLGIGVRLADGSPALAGWVRPARRMDADAPAFLIEDGRARVLTRPEPVTLEVNVPGHLIVLIEDVVQDREVVLEQAFDVTLVLPDGVRMPPEGTTLEIGLQRLSTPYPRPGSLRLLRGGRQAGWWSSTFGDGSNAFSIERGVRFSVQELGTFDVSFYLISGTPEGGRVAFEIDGTDDLEIGPGDAGRTFVVEPDPEVYQEHLAR